MNPAVKELKPLSDSAATSNAQCDFCHISELKPLEWGPMYHLDGVHVHYFCMLFSSGLSQNGEDEEGIFGFLPKDIRKEMKRGTKLNCKYCRKGQATIGCSVKTCKLSYHFPCGLRQNASFQFIGNFESYCSKHTQTVTIPLSRSEEDWKCPICTDEVTPEEQPLWPPCCKRRVFHKLCIMQMAVNHGAHFFKCPLCNDRDTFSEAMRKSGVFLPDRDATWEMEPNAFSEHTRLYSKCDAAVCACPKGREHESKDEGRPWKLVRCGACGASAIHKHCGQIKNLTWRCPTCAGILSGTSRIQRQQYDISSDEEDEPVPIVRVREIIERAPVIAAVKPSVVESKPNEATSREIVFDQVYRQHYLSDKCKADDSSTTSESEESEDEESEEEEEVFVSSSSSAGLRKQRNQDNNDGNTHTAEATIKQSDPLSDNVSNPVRTVPPFQTIPIKFPPFGKDRLIRGNFRKISLKSLQSQSSIEPVPTITTESTDPLLTFTYKAVSSKVGETRIDFRQIGNAQSSSDSPSGISKEKSPTGSNSNALKCDNTLQVSDQTRHRKISLGLLKSRDKTDLHRIESPDREKVKSNVRTENVETVPVEDDEDDIEIIAESSKSASLYEMIEKAKGNKPAPPPTVRLGVEDDENDKLEYIEPLAKNGDLLPLSRLPFPVHTAFLDTFNRLREGASTSKNHFNGSLSEKRKLTVGKSGPDQEVEVVELDSDDDDEIRDLSSKGTFRDFEGKVQTEVLKKSSVSHTPTATASSTPPRQKSTKTKRQRNI